MSNETKGYKRILDDAAHDLAHIARMIDGGRMRDDQGLAAALQLCDKVKADMIKHATTVNTQPVLFPN